jgi:hypothetical protein
VLLGEHADDRIELLGHVVGAPLHGIRRPQRAVAVADLLLGVVGQPAG